MKALVYYFVSKRFDECSDQSASMKQVVVMKEKESKKSESFLADLIGGVENEFYSIGKFENVPLFDK